MATIKALLAELKPRAQRLQLVDPATNIVDETELRFYMIGAMRFLANRYQLQHFLDMSRELFRTRSGLDNYVIPPNYGFITPEETYRSGVAVSESDGTQLTNLTYYDPARFRLVRDTSSTSPTTSKPAWFTLIGGFMHLAPIPDGVYIITAIERSVQDGSKDVPESYAALVSVETLWRFAADTNKVTPQLQEERLELTRAAVNNEARFRQQFYTSRERLGFGRHRRYGL